MPVAVVMCRGTTAQAEFAGQYVGVNQCLAAVVVGDRVTPYPIQIHTWGLPPRIRRDCLLGFIRAWAAPEGEQAGDFRAWVLERFGEGLAEHFFFPYNRKLYRAEPEELGLDWVGRYVPKPGLEPAPPPPP